VPWPLERRIQRTNTERKPGETQGRGEKKEEQESREGSHRKR